MKKIELNWKTGHSAELGTAPDRMVAARVPGNANLDWALATGMPDWKRGTGFEEYRWTENCWWLYEAQLPKCELRQGEQVFLVTEGIDYQYRIELDGKLLCEHEGMFSRQEIPLPASGGEVLRIWIAPVPKYPLGIKDTREEAAQCTKPAASYGWDWHPRLIPVGLWQDTYLEIRGASYIQDIQVDYELANDFSSADVTFTVNVHGEGDLSCIIYDAQGEAVARGQCVIRTTEDSEHKIKMTVNNPKLWWCNGYGEPNLYKYGVELAPIGTAAESYSGTIGFRTIALTMNEGAWEEPKEFPMGPSPAPITITLNGVPVFAKGSNWVNPEVFTGTITRETYEPLIKLAHQANFNILRCWGGSIINKKPFFELCDSCGILVWQEFMLSCNNYVGTKEYLRLLEQEAVAIIKKLKGHACIALWCGGNELFNNWSKMTNQSAALRLLDKLCYEHDPKRPYLMTSPLHGMAHGYYTFRYPDGREVFQVMPSAHHTAYTEFGVPSISCAETCGETADREQLFPLVKNAVTIAHHAFGAWGDAAWSYLDIINDYFGKAGSLEDLIEWSQWMQGEGYRCIFEEARRQKPYCSMAVNWCFNEPWPTLANNSLINYPATPKKSYQAVADACRSKKMSARIPKFTWRGGEQFTVDLWLLNDGCESVAAGEAAVSVELRGEVYALQTWKYGEAAANTNIEGPTLRFNLPEFDAGEGGELAALNSSGSERKKGTRHELKLKIEAGELSAEYCLLFFE
ncbi:MAG: hypothetical protein FWG94_10850 [Oscillospiraceae bacterium]|nr:hypothetical protein [Oscillospiraceae bacterium]